jgi:hypothetical protein
VFDSNNSRMVIFGGNSGLNDTWTIDPSQVPPVWSELNTGSGTAPSSRSFVSAAYDMKNLQLVLFGGLVQGTSPPFQSDTWVMGIGHGATTATWTQLSPTSSPPARAGAAGAFDAKNSRFIIIGGSASSGSLADVWALGLSSGNASANWSQLTTTGAFTGLTQASAYYDSANSRILVFGGGATGLGPTVGSLSSQLWSLDLSQTPAVWTALCPGGSSLPAARASAVLLGLPTGLFLYGGVLDPTSVTNGLDNNQYFLPYANIPSVCP